MPRTIATARTLAVGRQPRVGLPRVRTGYEPTIGGSVEIAGLDSSAAITLPVIYPSGSYTVTFAAVVTLSGIPALGALAPSATDKAREGFTVTLVAAPGVAASVSVPYTVTP